MAPGCGAGQVHVPGNGSSENVDDGSPGHAEQIDVDDDGPIVPGSGSQDIVEWARNIAAHQPLEQQQFIEEHHRELLGDLQRLRQRWQREEQQEHERQQDLQRIFTCDKCSGKACVPCDRPWHENESCAEYQLRIKDRTDEEDASLAAIQKETKKCPSCSKNILKNGGCKHMYCKSCTNPKNVENEHQLTRTSCRYPVPDRVLLGLFATDQPWRSVLRVQPESVSSRPVRR